MAKVLVADDEASLRFLITETLEIEDYEVIEAEDGEQAVKKIFDEQPDLVLLDLMMPKLSGYQVIDTMYNGNLEYTPNVIMLTAKGQQEDKDKAVELGIDYYMTKPFSPLELLDIVERVLEGDD